MGKLITLALLGSLVCRILTGRWPWSFWKYGKQMEKEKAAWVLLGVPPNASRAQIADATRRLIARVHPDRGGSNHAVHAATDARDLLIARLDKIEAKKK